ncbi:MAG: tRNA (adenosine(37)-N6)-threonylcarbamoyltransferase complex transferase subunit TsaD [Deltaproteobacteria bacterium]|nr:tRNA (adenosine(37)-N6)-threonylcarbamoyltransferase complex transferase subunit TsaD [Deltaproteobacteria bacterium]
MIILGIETSCDETAVAVVEDGEKILANTIASQDEVHEAYGGVVPEWASRTHLESLPVLLESTLKKANVSWNQIEAICVTQGPGLLGALLVGVSFAKSLAYSLHIPCVGVNHLEGHLQAAFLEAKVSYPFVGLLVSGGHTALYDVKNVGDSQILGTTLDDAAGEAFDKVAKILGLGYPGGREIDRLSRYGNKETFCFPRAYLDSENLHFSFSGLKTAVLHQVREFEEPFIPALVSDLAASFQEAVMDVLVEKTRRALCRTGYRTVVVAGGVACNSRLRERFKEVELQKNITVFFPSAKLCTDNAAMIAAMGYHSIRQGKASSYSFSPFANAPLVIGSP